MKHFLDFRKAVLVGPTPETIDQLPLLKQEILDGLYFRMMGFAKDRHMVRQLHQLQKDSIRLLNVIHPLEGPFYTLAHQCLIEILENLKLYKYKYFDRQQAIPIYLAEEIGSQFEEKLRLLEAGMKKKKITANLQTVVLSPFRNFGKKGYSNYEQMDYLVYHVDEFIAEISNSNTDERSLLWLLLHKGFNTADFQHYYTLKMAAEVQAEYKVDAQFHILYRYERALSMLPKKPYRIYDSGGRKTRDVLLAFIHTELHYLSKQHEFTVQKPFTPSLALSTYRLETSLTVDIFAYFIRLLIENQAIEANPRSALMDFLAAHLKTKRKGDDHVSANSLTVKYKQVTQTTAIGIRSLLLRMLKQVEADFRL